MNVAELLARGALEHPHRSAIVDCTSRPPRVTTFAELEQAAQHSARAFAAAGLQPGARILVLHPMATPLYVALAGMFRAGLVPVVCEPSAVARLPFVPDALFANALLSAYGRVAPGLRRIRLHIGPHDLDAAAGTFPIADVSHEAAILTATSGTTGEPKIVVRSHAILNAQLDAVRSTVPLDGIDVATMPIVLLANIAAGVTSVIPGVDLRRPGAADPERLADDIAATGATSIVASPAMLARLVGIDARDRVRSLRRIVSGGAPVMPSLLDALREVAPEAEVIALYGSTEAEPIARLRSTEIDAADRAAMRQGAGLLAGRVAAHTEVRIIPARWSTPLGPFAGDQALPSLAAGAAGEIVVRGPHVVPGYLDPRHDAGIKIRCGEHVWHRTGDLGRFDERGRLWLLGRADAVRADALAALAPLQIECALSFDPRIARAALLHVGGRRVIAVERRQGMHLDVHELRRAMGWASVDEIRVVRSIPVDRRHNAKVDARRLERRLARRP